jgi:hypothetical protein
MTHQDAIAAAAMNAAVSEAARIVSQAHESGKFDCVADLTQFTKGVITNMLASSSPAMINAARKTLEECQHRRCG